MRPDRRTYRRDRCRSGAAAVALVAWLVVFGACKDRRDGQPYGDAAVERAMGPSALERLCRVDADACAGLQAVETEALSRAKAAREAELAARASRAFLCTAGLRECVATYAELRGLDWRRTNLAAGLPVIIDEDAPLAVGPGYVSFGPRADRTADQLAPARSAGRGQMPA